MNNLETRLAQCFRNVFPDLSDSSIPAASTDTVSAWDSVAHITLLSAVSEEFGIDWEPEDYVELASFQQIADRLKERS